LTKEQKGSGPTPEIEIATDSLLAWVQESDRDTSLKDGKVKETTGGDRYFSRGCNSDGGVKEATFKLWWMCNRPPQFQDPDDAILDRVLLIPYLSKWLRRSEFDKYTEEERKAKKYFLRNEYFRTKIPYMGSAMLKFMVQGYKKYRQEGLKTPQIVKEYTEEYWEKTDQFLMFATDCLEKVSDGNGGFSMEAFVTEDQVWSEYRKWAKDRDPDAKVGKKEIFLESFSNRMGKSQRGKWTGVQIKNPGMTMQFQQASF